MLPRQSRRRRENPNDERAGAGKEMINRMVFSNLGHRPIRTALSVIAVAVEVLLIISVVGLVHGLLDEAARRQKGLGADIVVRPPGSSHFTGMSSAPMPVKIGSEVLQKVEGVKAVTPVFGQTFGGLTVVYGIDKESFNQVTGGLQIIRGRDLGEGFELVVDDVYAESNNLKVGDKHELFSNDFTVVGVAKHGKGAR